MEPSTTTTPTVMGMPLPSDEQKARLEVAAMMEMVRRFQVPLNWRDIPPEQLRQMAESLRRGAAHETHTAQVPANGEIGRLPTTEPGASATQRIAESRLLQKPDTCLGCQGAEYYTLAVPYGHPHFGVLFPCEVCGAVAARRRQLLKELNDYDPVTMARMTFASFDLDAPDVQHGFDAARDFSDRIALLWAGGGMLRAGDNEGWALTLWGDYGVGKSHLLAAIYNHLSAVGVPALYCYCAELWPRLGCTRDNDDEISYEKRIRAVEGAPVLLLDEPNGIVLRDGSVASLSAGAVKVRGRIVEYRYSKKLPTVFMANQHPDEWSDGAVSDRVVAVPNDVIQHGGAQSYRRHVPGDPWAMGEGEPKRAR